MLDYSRLVNFDSNPDSRKSANAEVLDDLRARVEYTLLEQRIPAHPEKAPLVYEDALLRKFSIDLEFIASCTLSHGSSPLANFVHHNNNNVQMTSSPQ